MSKVGGCKSLEVSPYSDADSQSASHKIFLPFCGGSGSFITLFKGDHHSTPSCASWILL